METVPVGKTVPGHFGFWFQGCMVSGSGLGVQGLGIRLGLWHVCIIDDKSVTEVDKAG